MRGPSRCLSTLACAARLAFSAAVRARLVTFGLLSPNDFCACHLFTLKGLTALTFGEVGSRLGSISFSYETIGMEQLVYVIIVCDMIGSGRSGESGISEIRLFSLSWYVCSLDFRIFREIIVIVLFMVRYLNETN